MILDDLYADTKAVPMIVVLPDGRASKVLTCKDPIPKQSPAFVTPQPIAEAETPNGSRIATPHPAFTRRRCFAVRA